MYERKYESNGSNGSTVSAKRWSLPVNMSTRLLLHAFWKHYEHHFLSFFRWSLSILHSRTMYSKYSTLSPLNRVHGNLFKINFTKYSVVSLPQFTQHFYIRTNSCRLLPVLKPCCCHLNSTSVVVCSVIFLLSYKLCFYCCLFSNLALVIQSLSLLLSAP